MSLTDARFCPKNERCELKDTVRSVELDLRTPLNYNRRDLPIHADDPLLRPRLQPLHCLCKMCSRVRRGARRYGIDACVALWRIAGRDISRDFADGVWLRILRSVY